ncbi:MAG: hypothetical protein AAB864_02350 [Patescibacteria group bacterium]
MMPDVQRYLDLADGARKKLGYSVLGRQIQDAVARHQEQLEDVYALERIANAFRSLSIKKFTPDSVQRFKQEKLADANLGMCLTESLSKTLIVMFFVTWVLAMISEQINWRAPVSFLVVSICWFFVSLELDLKEWQWQRYHLKGYGRRIPERAIAKALALQELLPGAKFYVDELAVRQREIVTVGDPFLVMEYGGYVLYVDVWDEPEFEGRYVS